MMKTEIIISKGWKIIKEYAFPITLTTDDIVIHEEVDYRVDSCVLDLDESKISILLK